MQAIVGLSPDLVVLDEVQLIKRRERGGSSIRRETLEGMLRQLPKTRVLGMTATPVINELREGVSLLEAVTGKPQNLKTGHSVLNALNLHFALLQHGLRYKPEYQQSLSIKPEPFVENALVPALQDAAPTVLAIERMILPAKLEQVRDRIKPGTLIYLEFVEGMVPIVRKFVESLGLTVGEYIGDTPTKERESSKQKFIKGELDVLIGSRPVGLGMDGLQKRCNRLIVLSLPWTHAAFQQLYGRVYRQGSGFAEVEILIPQLVATVDGKRCLWWVEGNCESDPFTPCSGAEVRRRNQNPLRFLETLAIELQRPAILGDSANNALGSSRRKLSFDLNCDLHLSIQQAS